MYKPATLYSNYSINDNNNIFKDDSEILSIDSKEPHIKLKEVFKNYGYDLSTKDLNKVENSSFTIFYDMPLGINEINIPENSYLILWECEVIAPSNWVLKNHLKFKKIFTWDNSLVDNVKYFKIQYPNKLNFSVKSYEEKKLVTMLAGNKYSSHPLELYSHRKTIIRWFEKNKIDNFEFYGIGWDKLVTSNRYFNFLLKKLNLNELLSSTYQNYKGFVNDKKNALENYKFCFCFENSINEEEYISEKIFDCFSAGTVPIYLGSKKINNTIPSNTMILYSEFKNINDLYQHLTSMKKTDYDEIILNIKNFLKSKEASIYSVEHFTKTITENILADIKIR